MQNESDFLKKKVREHFNALNPQNDPHKAVWLVSVDNERYESKAGMFVSAYVGHTQFTNTPIVNDTFVAPRLLAEGTHRLATPDEVDAYLKAQDVRREKLRAEESARKVPFAVTVQQDPALMALVLEMAQKLADQKAAPVVAPVAPVVEKVIEKETPKKK